MRWVDEGRLPDLREWQQLSILCVAMIATVLSWDGYLVAIDERELKGFWRFAIDILLVFLYMFLLITSKHLTWWIFIHVITFILYVIWDILTIKEHIEKYYYDPKPERLTIIGVYLGGLKDSAYVKRGPITTLTWTFYFLGLFLITRTGLKDYVFVTSVFAGCGLILYRRDKRLSFSMCRRLLTIIVTLVIAFLYSHYLTMFNDTYFARWLGLI